ncbi:hypothetical protein K2173_002946 [Erythroxylum novogranatense]|uniref:Cation/H+ exchanger domain-containing protein n=1 Tax=Erythroxylum novogranatense TaxID=1862640 RepID=A0AAV8TSK0_9ROSI|nr:hypothetical protein K2173_002946 [Erythroxylum novogranatense]
METQKSVVNISGECFDYVRVFSDGVWNVRRNESILQHSLVRFHLQLVSFVFVSNLFHFLLKRFNLSRITSEILAGFILGSSGVGGILDAQGDALFPPFPDQVFASLSKLGYILFTFLAAVRNDLSLVKQMGTKALIFGFLLFLVPVTMESSTSVLFPHDETLSFTVRAQKQFLSSFYISIMTSSQFVGVSTILMQLKITNSRLGHFALASTLVGDLMRFGYMSLNGFRRAILSTSARIGAQVILLSLIFVAVILVVLRSMIHWFIRRTPEDKPMKEVYITVTLAILLGLASIGDSVGMHYLFGPFILGLVVPAGSPLATALVAKVDTLVSGLLIPLLLTFCSTRFDIVDFVHSFNQALTFQAALMGYMIKLIISIIGAINCKLPLREAAALALIVNAKGVIEIGLLLSFGNLELRNVESTSGIFFVFLLSGILPPLIKVLYNPAKQYIGYTKKCIEYAPNDEEFTILVCSHRQEDVVAAIKLLEYCNPTKQSPLCILGLCLEELVSSLTPVLINHQLGQKASSLDGSRSQPIIDIYRYFKSQNDKFTQVNVFTAISPLKQMHEDICWLAFDKTVSLIILPFHKKWNNKGKMISNSTDLRNLNINVLDRASCSVGILIDRHRNHILFSTFSTSEIYQVATLFIGGPDDRESLAFALRMAGNPCVQLTVMHFVAENNRPHDKWEEMLDLEALRKLKEVSKSANVGYREDIVRDGSDTAAIVRSIAGHYKLVITGRHHEPDEEAVSGLKDWSELPELGPIGDLLAASEIDCKASVLVVQQQIMKASHSGILN